VIDFPYLFPLFLTLYYQNRQVSNELLRLILDGNLDEYASSVVSLIQSLSDEQKSIIVEAILISTKVKEKTIDTLLWAIDDKIVIDKVISSNLDFQFVSLV